MSLLHQYLLNWFLSEAWNRITEEGHKDEKSPKEEKSEVTDSQERTELGGVFALNRELAGLTDFLPRPTITIGNGLKYYRTKLGKKNLVLVESGVGPEKAAAATESLIQVFHPERIISAGYAAGLSPELTRNQLVIPNRIIFEKTGDVIDLWNNLLPEPDSDTGKQTKNTENPSCESKGQRRIDLSRFATGTLLTVDRTIETPKEKKELAKRFNASLLDMETWSVARVCQLHGIPFLPLRIILDSVEEPISHEIAYMANTVSSPARLAGAFFGALMKRPACVMEMYHLKENSLVASDLLGKALTALLSEDRKDP